MRLCAVVWLRLLRVTWLRSHTECLDVDPFGTLVFWGEEERCSKDTCISSSWAGDRQAQHCGAWVGLFRVPASRRGHWCVNVSQEPRACLIHSAEILDEDFLLSPTCCGAWLSSWKSPPVSVCGNGLKREERWRAQLNCSLLYPPKQSTCQEWLHCPSPKDYYTEGTEIISVCSLSLCYPNCHGLAEWL